MNKPRTLLEGKPYVPAKNTDIRKTWAQHGWQPKHVSTERLPDTSLIYQSNRSKHYD